MPRSQCAQALCVLGIFLSCFLKEANSKGSELGPPIGIGIAHWPFGMVLTPDSATIQWYGPRNAHSFMVTINSIVNDEQILHQEIKNVKGNSLVLQGLESSTEYEVVIKSVRIESDGSVQMSEGSKPFRFTTREACKGGMIHTACDGGNCFATCEHQSPACPRDCIVGCACPSKKPFRHEGTCVTKQQCKEFGSKVEVLQRPTGLKFLKITGSTDILFTWKPVKGADFYTVIVRNPEGKEIQVIDNIKVPIVRIKGLVPKIKYKIKVQAKWVKFSGDGNQRSGSLLAQIPPLISDIQERSLLVDWPTVPNAKSYKLVLYSKGKGEILVIFKDLKSTSMTLQGLEPGTSYEISVITVGDNFEEESGSVSVTMKGKAGTDTKPDTTQIEVVVVQPTTTPPPTQPTTTAYVATCMNRKTAVDAYYKSNPGATSGPDRVACDSSGNYMRLQCRQIEKDCYCADRKSGKMRPGSGFSSPRGKYYLDCSKYGQFSIADLKVSARAVNSGKIKVRWTSNDDALFYIVKVYDAFGSDLITSKSGITGVSTAIEGLPPGQTIIVTVIAVDRQHKSSSDRVKGVLVKLPYLDPPADFDILHLPGRYRVTWTKSERAEHYQLEVYRDNEKTPKRYENITKNILVFPVENKVNYRVVLRASAVLTFPGLGRETMTYSAPVEMTRTPFCSPIPLDVIFAIDVSTKMSPEEYAKAKKLFYKLTESLSPIVSDKNLKNGTRIATVKAHDMTRVVFRHTKFDAAKRVVGALKYMKQSSMEKLKLGKMFHEISKRFFQVEEEEFKLRSGVEHVVVTFIGGKSDDPMSSASLLQGKAYVISVGVKNEDTEKSMMIAASRPDMTVVIPSYDHIEEAYQAVMELICNLQK